MTTNKRGGYRIGSGSKPHPPAEVASVRIVANVTPAEAEEWARRGRTAWLRAELRARIAEREKWAERERQDMNESSARHQAEHGRMMDAPDELLCGGMQSQGSTGFEYPWPMKTPRRGGGKAVPTIRKLSATDSQ